jgi:uncharacterized damage-inducible protein DinB
MVKSYFFEMFQYNDWANEQIFNAFKFTGPVPEKCLLLLSHILASQDAWYERITGNHNWNIQLWDVYTLQECVILSSQSTQNWLKLVRKLKEKDFDNLIAYKNTKGNDYESAVRDILAHVINHSTYHRAQINQLLKGNGISPALTDFIFYTRL